MRDVYLGLQEDGLVAIRHGARALVNDVSALQRLVITRRTAGSHIEHIYVKTGASNRARASRFAMTHGLMSDFEPA